MGLGFRRILLSSILLLTTLPTVSAAPENYLVVNGDIVNRQQVEPSIAIDPLNPDVIVSSVQDMRKVPEFGNRWNSYYRSVDGGKTWKNDLLPGYPTDASPQGIASPLKQYQFTSDPLVAFDAHGNAYFAGLAVNRTSGKSAVFMVRYSIHGSHYEYTTIVAANSNNGVPLDKPYLFTDNTLESPYFGSIYVTWTEVGVRPGYTAIYFARSTDMARSFSSPLLLSDRSERWNQFSAVAAGPEGSIYATWVSWDSSRNWIKLTRSSDNGFSFSTPKTITYIHAVPSPLPGNGFRVMSFPAVAVDTSSGRGSGNLYVAWSEWKGRDSDMLFMRSLDKGETWSSPHIINDDLAGNQFMPVLAVSEGKIFAAFYDGRLDASARNNKALDLFYAVSHDEGRSFSKNSRVTTISFDPNAVCRCPVFSQPFLGDYIGVSSTGSRVIVIWTDNRNASPSRPLNQDVFVAELDDIESSEVSYEPFMYVPKLWWIPE